jgi:hypothetical protein
MANEFTNSGEDKMFHKRSSTQVLMCVFLYNVLFCWIGVYTYAQADDYAYLNMLKAGFWEAQKSWYMDWTGRCANTVLVSLACFFDLPRIYFLLPCLNALLNIAVFYTLLTAIAERMSTNKKFLMALLLQAVWFSYMPGLNQNFYWLCGMPYTWTATLSLLVAATLVYLLRKQNRGILFALLPVLVLFNGTILEQTSLAQMGIFFLLTLYYIRRGERRSMWTTGMAFIAATAAFLVMYFAPGTAIRISGGFNGLNKNILQTFSVAAVFGGFSALKFFIKPIIYLVILYMPVIVKAIPPFDAKATALLRVKHIVLFVILVAAGNQAIHGFAVGTPLPLRAEGLTMWMMAAVWLFLWVFCYRNKKLFAKIEKLKIYPWRNLILVLCLLLSPNFIALTRDIRIAPLYAQEMEERYASTEQQKREGKKVIFLPSLKFIPKSIFYSDLTLSPENTLNNIGYSKYYGVYATICYPHALMSDGEEFTSLQDVVEKMKLTANNGDLEILFKLGEVYDSLFPFPAMDDFSKDNTLAAQYYLQAAQRGYAPAQSRLIRVYATAAGVPRDYFRALGWVLRSFF